MQTPTVLRTHWMRRVDLEECPPRTRRAIEAELAGIRATHSLRGSLGALESMPDLSDVDIIELVAQIYFTPHSLNRSTHARIQVNTGLYEMPREYRHEYGADILGALTSEWRGARAASWARVIAGDQGS